MFILQLLFVQIVAFVVLVFFLQKMMNKASYTETKRLQALSEDNEQKARELANQSAKLEAEHREKMAAAEDEARKLRAKAREDAEKLKEDLLVNAKKEKDRIIQQAMNSKERMREEIAEEMFHKGVEFSRQMVCAVLSSKHQKAIHDGFVDEVVDEIKAIEKNVFRALSEAKESALTAEVRTPHALSPDQRDRIIRGLSPTIGKKINLNEVIDKKVVAGIIIKMTNVVIDGSLMEKLKRASGHIRRNQ